MIGAYDVHQHILHFPMLIAVAMLGSFIGDQFYNQMGARYGQKLIQSNAEFAQKFDRASQFIERYPILTILFMRFAWGFRTILPIAVGVRAYPVWKYVLINLVACFIWAMLVATIGFQISHYLHLLWGDAVLSSRYLHRYCRYFMYHILPCALYGVEVVV